MKDGDLLIAEAGAGALGDTENSGSTHRFYEKEFPDMDELVVVRVNNVDDIGAYVSLLEYGNRDGYILLSELSRRRMRSVNKHIRAGRREVLQVLRVDHAKGYIDLSKKNLKPEEVEVCTERFRKSSAVHGIISHIFSLQKPEDNPLSLDLLYQKVVWPLSNKFGHAFAAFESAAAGNETVFSDLEISQSLKELLSNQVAQRLKAQEVKIQADIQVSCFSEAGVDGIKPALKAAQAVSSDVNVHLFSSPDYAIFVKDKDRARGIALVTEAVAAVKAEIIKHGGSCVVKAEPRVMSAD